VEDRRTRLSLRPATIRDAVVCGPICYEAFKAIAEQHNFPTDFPTLEGVIGMLSADFARPDFYAMVAEVDAQVVGSVCMLEHEPIAGIGPLTVAPAMQNSGIGRRMMEHLLQRAAEKRFAGVRLMQDAYHSRSLALYVKLGFDAREPLSLLQGNAFRVEIPGYAVRPTIEEDLPACNQLCLRIHGYARGQELLYAVHRKTATVVEHDGRITGYATSVGFNGHAIGESNEALKALLGAAEAFSGSGFLLPTRNGELLRFCLEQGLRVVKPVTLMSLGLYNEPAGAFLPSILR
jgi:GNAT superfamily N-acetyltransferase